jgi:hypothetical protein
VEQVMRTALCAIVFGLGVFVLLVGPNASPGLRVVPSRVRLLGLAVMALAVVAVWQSFS